jgi:hypothetical protein
MNCTHCGAPVLPGETLCAYCGYALGSGMVMGAAGAGTTRALAPDGRWHPVACSALPRNMFLVCFHDGRQATLSAEEVHQPCSAERLRPGQRVLGEYEGHYFPGTVRCQAAGGWNVVFDDNETAILPADRLCVCDAPMPPLPPGTRVLAQGPDGAWHPARVVSGQDMRGRQKVRVDTGGIAECSRAQLNGPAWVDLLRAGRRVMGIGPDGWWYPGTVQQVAEGQCCIRFDDGEEAWVLTHEVRFIC